MATMHRSNKYFHTVQRHAMSKDLDMYFKRDVSQTQRIRLAKRIQKKGKKVTLYPDGRLNVWDFV